MSLLSTATRSLLALSLCAVACSGTPAAPDTSAPDHAARAEPQVRTVTPGFGWKPGWILQVEQGFEQVENGEVEKSSAAMYHLHVEPYEDGNLLLRPVLQRLQQRSVPKEGEAGLLVLAMAQVGRVTPLEIEVAPADGRPITIFDAETTVERVLQYNLDEYRQELTAEGKEAKAVDERVQFMDGYLRKFINHHLVFGETEAMWEDLVWLWTDREFRPGEAETFEEKVPLPIPVAEPPEALAKGRIWMSGWRPCKEDAEEARCVALHYEQKLEEEATRAALTAFAGQFVEPFRELAPAEMRPELEKWRYEFERVNRHERIDVVLDPRTTLPYSMVHVIEVDMLYVMTRPNGERIEKPTKMAVTRQATIQPLFLPDAPPAPDQGPRQP